MNEVHKVVWVGTVKVSIQMINDPPVCFFRSGTWVAVGTATIHVTLPITNHISTVDIGGCNSGWQRSGVFLFRARHSSASARNLISSQLQHRPTTRRS